MIDAARPGHQKAGGRPPHPIADLLVPIIGKLKRARTVDIQSYWSTQVRPGETVSNHCVKRHAEVLVAQGILSREVELDSTPKVKAGLRRRVWQMTWYSLK